MTDPKNAVATRAADPDFARPQAAQFAMVPHMEMFEAPELFEHYQRVAKLMSTAAIVPKHFQGRPADCFIALSIARATRQDPMVVMQNIYVADGRAGWYSKYLIARANMSGRLKGIIRFEKFLGNPTKKGSQERVKAPWGEVDNICIRAYGHLADIEGDDLIESYVDMELAIADGWVRNAKYRSMPEQMLRWRAASWLVNANMPEVMLGMSTAEELQDGAVDDADRLGPGVRPATPRPQRPNFREGAVDMTSTAPADTDAAGGGFDDGPGAEDAGGWEVFNVSGEKIADAQEHAGALAALVGEMRRAKDEKTLQGILGNNEHLLAEGDAAANIKAITDDLLGEFKVKAASKAATTPRSKKADPKPADPKPADTPAADPTPPAQTAPAAEAPAAADAGAPPQDPPEGDGEAVVAAVLWRTGQKEYLIPFEAEAALKRLDEALAAALTDGGKPEAMQCWEANLPIMGVLRQTGFGDDVDKLQDDNADRVKRWETAQKTASATTPKTDPAPAADGPDDLPVIATPTGSDWTPVFKDTKAVLEKYADKSPEWFQAFYDRNREVIHTFRGRVSGWASALDAGLKKRGVTL